MDKPDIVNDGIGHWVAGAVGALVYILIASVGQSPVAWSSVSYFVFGWPILCVGIWLITRQFPQRSWRWPLSMMLGQVFASILYGNGATIPIAMIYVTVLSLPQFAVAALVSSHQAGSPRSGVESDVQTGQDATDEQQKQDKQP
ncbi:MAG: hypothetical protein CMQ46_09570 [Gammaproteobacteria bacterium]|nr:hypothetical protein [Gammaproteobacteria bacterium]MBJ55496.1 hypothetical protein [Gammaproteobacteria bacterium]|tara:strand:- start:187 stop:618 length:432 start_codon:yes stop_codon:yes gene_type:complete